MVRLGVLIKQGMQHEQLSNVLTGNCDECNQGYWHKVGCISSTNIWTCWVPELEFSLKEPAHSVYCKCLGRNGDLYFNARFDIDDYLLDHFRRSVEAMCA